MKLLFFFIILLGITEFLDVRIENSKAGIILWYGRKKRKYIKLK